jgi:hypothetical protein
LRGFPAEVGERRGEQTPCAIAAKRKKAKARKKE